MRRIASPSCYWARPTSIRPWIPCLLLSVGIVESGFERRARSSADARGLYQIWPSTGRMLAAMLGWEYSDEMLYDEYRNTELAALYSGRAHDDV